MVLHREHAVPLAPQAFHASVKQIDVRNFQSRSRNRRFPHRVAVVLGGDFHPSVQKILDRMVSAAMTEFQLVGFCAVSKRDHLVTEADSENRQFSAQLAHQADNRRNVLRVSRPVGKEEPVGIHPFDLLCGRIKREHRHIASSAVERPHDIFLHPAVDCRHTADRFPDGGRETHFFGRHPRHRVMRNAICADAPHTFFGRRVGGGQKPQSASLVADATRQAAGIQSFQSRNAAGFHPVRKTPRAAEVGRFVVALAHQKSAHTRVSCFVVLVVDPVVSDQRVGHHHRLIGVGRVGDNLLIPDHRGVEHHLANAFVRRAEAIPEVFASVLQNQFSVVNSCHTVFPPVTVATHFPFTVHPANGVLFPFDAKRVGSTV